MRATWNGSVVGMSRSILCARSFSKMRKSVFLQTGNIVALRVCDHDGHRNEGNVDLDDPLVPRDPLRLMRSAAWMETGWQQTARSNAMQLKRNIAVAVRRLWRSCSHVRQHASLILSITLHYLQLSRTVSGRKGNRKRRCETGAIPPVGQPYNPAHRLSVDVSDLFTWYYRFTWELCAGATCRSLLHVKMLRSESPNAFFHAA